MNASQIEKLIKTMDELTVMLDEQNKRYQLSVQVVDVYNAFYKKMGLEKEFEKYLNEQLKGDLSGK